MHAYPKNFGWAGYIGWLPTQCHTLPKLGGQLPTVLPRFPRRCQQEEQQSTRFSFGTFNLELKVQLRKNLVNPKFLT